MTTANLTGDATRTTVALAGTEISAYGGRLLSALSAEADGFSSWVPLRWSEWSTTDGLPERVRTLLAQLDELTVARERREPIEITVDNLDEFRSMLADGIQAQRETLGDAIDGNFTAKVDAVTELNDAAAHLAALIAILDRVGWGDSEPKGLDVLRLVAERLA